MQLQNTFPASLIPVASLAANSKGWQVGQILLAIVQGRDQQGLLQLKIDDNTLSASTTLAYHSGQKLRLKVIDNREGLILQKLDHDQAQTKVSTLEQLLRQSLPKQDKLQSLVQNLNQLLSKLNPPVLDSPALPKPVFEHLLKTQSLLPTAEQLVDPQSLKQTIKNSGLFLEAKLAENLVPENKSSGMISTSPVKADLKANLLDLANTIEHALRANREESALVSKTTMPSPEKYKGKNYGQSNNEEIELLSLRRVVESAIAKLQINQSQAIVTEEQILPVWIIDLPIMDEKNENTMALKIHYEDTQKQAEYPTRKWNVNLSFDIAPLGKIQVCLKLFGEELSSSIWAERTLTNNLIKQYLPSLEKRLQQSGLNVVSINQHPIMQQDPGMAPQRMSLVSTMI